MGSAKRGERCKRHRKHEMSKGVCPSCLREKLTRLSSMPSSHPYSCHFSSAAALAMAVDSSSSFASSCSSSSYSSNSYLSSSPSSMASPSYELEITKRSRSMAAARLALGKEKRKVVGRKNGGFWSKLLAVF